MWMLPSPIPTAHPRSRLSICREALSNVSIRYDRTDATDVFEVAGRGELQIAILIETMRREGYEFAVGRPRVLFKETDQGIEEPIEQVKHRTRLDIETWLFYTGLDHIPSSARTRG